jgi:hypothetical protein
MIAVRTISVYYMLSAIGVEGWNPTAPIVSAASVGDEHGVSRKQIRGAYFDAPTWKRPFVSSLDSRCGDNYGSTRARR